MRTPAPTRIIFALRSHAVVLRSLPVFHHVALQSRLKTETGSTLSPHSLGCCLCVSPLQDPITWPMPNDSRLCSLCYPGRDCLPAQGWSPSQEGTEEGASGPPGKPDAAAAAAPDKKESPAASFTPDPPTQTPPAASLSGPNPGAVSLEQSCVGCDDTSLSLVAAQDLDGSRLRSLSSLNKEEAKMFFFLGSHSRIVATLFVLPPRRKKHRSRLGCKLDVCSRSEHICSALPET